MKYPRKFFLNLTSNSISLGIKENQNQYVLDSFDPNEPAASEGLKKLFNLNSLRFFTLRQYLF